MAKSGNCGSARESLNEWPWAWPPKSCAEDELLKLLDEVDDETGIDADDEGEDAVAPLKADASETGMAAGMGDECLAADDRVTSASCGSMFSLSWVTLSMSLLQREWEVGLSDC